MREERGKLAGDVAINEPYTLWGMIVGDVSVQKEGKFYLRGSIYGNLTIEEGGRAHIFGTVQGKVTVEAYAKVIHSGIVGGDLLNKGGRLYVELSSKTMGKIRTKDGTTTFEPKQKYLEE
jgi:cytoskeletal protein CcmA (bactofilin family)